MNLDSTRIDQLVTLRSPFNGEVVTMHFLPGVPPTLEAMLHAGFVQLPEPKGKTRPKEMSHGSSED